MVDSLHLNTSEPLFGIVPSDSQLKMPRSNLTKAA